MCIPLIPLIFNLSVLSFLPETPRWLLSKGKQERGLKEYQRIYGSGLHVDRAFQQLVCDMSSQYDVVITDGCERKRHRAPNVGRRFALTVILQTTNTFFSGFGILLSFSSQVFALSGLSVKTSGILAGCNLTSYAAFFLLGFATTDKVGRRPILILGALGCGVMLLIVGILQALMDMEGSTSNPSLGAATIACIFLYTACHASSYASLSWVYPSEIFPQSLRTYGGTASIVSFATGNALSTFLASYLLSTIGGHVFFLFGSLSLLASFTLWAILPEVNGLSLEEIDEVFRSGVICNPKAARLLRRRA